MPPKKSAKKACSEEDKLAEIDKAGFIHMPAPNDGNCFYHSLATYLRMLQVDGLRDKSIQELREETVDYMIENIAEIDMATGDIPANHINIPKEEWVFNPVRRSERLDDILEEVIHRPATLSKHINKFRNVNANRENTNESATPVRTSRRTTVRKNTGKIARIRAMIEQYKKDKITDPLKEELIIQNSNYNKTSLDPGKKLARVEAEIEKLRKNGVWSSEMGDSVPSYAARKYNIKLQIYDWRWQECKLVVLTSNEGNADSITAHVLRVNDGHFEVIFPKDLFKGLAKAIGGHELANMSKYNAEKTAERLSKSSKSLRGSYLSQLEEYLADAKRGLTYVKEAMPSSGNVETFTELEAQTQAIVTYIKHTIVKYGGSVDNSNSNSNSNSNNDNNNSSLYISKKTADKLKKVAVSFGINIERVTIDDILSEVLSELEEQLGESNNSNSSSSVASARPPTPPKRHVTRKKSTSSSSNSSNTNSSRSVASAKSNGSGTRKKSTSPSPKKSSGTRTKSQLTIAKMRKQLIANGINIPRNATNEGITGLYQALY